MISLVMPDSLMETVLLLTKGFCLLRLPDGLGDSINCFWRSGLRDIKVANL